MNYVQIPAHNAPFLYHLLHQILPGLFHVQAVELVIYYSKEIAPTYVQMVLLQIISITKLNVQLAKQDVLSAQYHLVCVYPAL